MTYVSSREHTQAEIMELLAMAHGNLQDIETIKEIPEGSCALIPALKQIEIMDLRKATKELIYEIFDICTQYVNDLRENIKIQRALPHVMTDEMEKHIILVEERIELIQRFAQALAKKVSLDLTDYPALQAV